MAACGVSFFIGCKLACLGHFPMLVSGQFFRVFVYCVDCGFVFVWGLCVASWCPSIFFVVRRSSCYEVMLFLRRVCEWVVLGHVLTFADIDFFLLGFGIRVALFVSVIGRLLPFLDVTGLLVSFCPLLVNFRRPYPFVVVLLIDLVSHLYRLLDGAVVGALLVIVSLVVFVRLCLVCAVLGGGTLLAFRRVFAAAPVVVPLL